MGRFRSQSDWKKYLPIALVVALLFGAYQLYDWRAKRAFRRGFTHGVTAMVHNIPYLGARFNKKAVRSGRAYRRGGKYRKSTAKRYRKGRRYRGRKARKRSRRRRR